MTDKYYSIVPREIHAHVSSMSYIHINGDREEIENIRKLVTAEYGDLTEISQKEFDRVSHVNNLVDEVVSTGPTLDR